MHTHYSTSDIDWSCRRKKWSKNCKTQITLCTQVIAFTAKRYCLYMQCHAACTAQGCQGHATSTRNIYAELLWSFCVIFFTNGVLYLPANAECRWKKLLQVPNNLQHQPTIPFTNTCILYLPSHANMSSSFQPSYSGHLRPCQRLVSTKLKQKIRQRAMQQLQGLQTMRYNAYLASKPKAKYTEMKIWISQILRY